MADPIVKSLAARGSLLVLQATQESRARLEAQLATGRDASPVRDPQAHYGASTLRARAEAFEATLDGIGLAGSSIEAAMHGLEAARGMLKTMRGRAEGLRAHAAPAQTHGTEIRLLDGVRADTDIATLDVNNPTPGALAFPHHLGIDVRDETNAVTARNYYRYTTAEPKPADLTWTPGASTWGASRLTYVRTLGDLVEAINTTDDGATARLESGQLVITADDATTGLFLHGHRDMREALGVMHPQYWPDLLKPSTQGLPRVVGTREGLTRDTNLASFGTGVANWHWLGIPRGNDAAGTGRTMEQVYYNTTGRADLGGDTVGDFLDYINMRMPQTAASLDEAGRFVIESKDGRGIFLWATASLRNALGLEQQIYWGGAEDAPKALTGWKTGLTSDTNAVAGTGWMEDGQGGRVRFLYGNTQPWHDGTTLGDFVNTVNAANDAGEVALRASFTAEGRVRIESTGGTNTLPLWPGWMPLRQAGLSFWDTAAPVPGDLWHFPETSASLSDRQWEDYQALENLAADATDLLRDAAVDARNLAGDTPLSVAVNDGNARITLGDVTLTDLGLDDVLDPFAISYADDVDALIGKIDQALKTVEGRLGLLAVQSAALDVRRDFNAALANGHREGADAWTAVKPQETGAALLAVQTRQQMAANALALVGESDRSVLRLFG